MLRIVGCLLAFVLALVACSDDTGGDGDGGQAAAGGAGAGGSATCPSDQYECPDQPEGCCNCPTPGQPTEQFIDGYAARFGDVDGDGQLDAVSESMVGTLVLWTANRCGHFVSRGAVSTGTDQTDQYYAAWNLAQIDGAPGVELVTITEDFLLTAYAGADLTPLWSETLSGLASARAVLGVHMDGDGDHDVAVFDASFANLLRVENTGSGWDVRAQVALPPGIDNVAAGDLGGGPRDELLFLGGGLVQVVSVADFDYSDVRVLSSSPHEYAAFADFDGDGASDVLVSSGGAAVEFWKGDGNTQLSMSATSPVQSSVAAIAAHLADGAPAAEGAVLSSTGVVQLVSGGTTITEQLMFADAAGAVGSGDIDGDGRADLVVSTAGRLWVRRTP